MDRSQEEELRRARGLACGVGSSERERNYNERYLVSTRTRGTGIKCIGIGIALIALSLSWHCSEKYLVTTGNDGTARVWRRPVPTKNYLGHTVWPKVVPEDLAKVVPKVVAGGMMDLGQMK